MAGAAYARAELQHVSNANRYLDTRCHSAGAAARIVRRGFGALRSHDGKLDFDVFATNLFDERVIIGESVRRLLAGDRRAGRGSNDDPATHCRRQRDDEVLSGEPRLDTARGLLVAGASLCWWARRAGCLRRARSATSMAC